MSVNLEHLLSDLLKQGKIKKQATDHAYLNGLLTAAHRNFQAAEAVIFQFDETAFKSAYDGLLQISRAILLINGYRPDDGGQHYTAFMVAGALLGEEFQSLTKRLDRYRRIRNECIYQPVDLISHAEAESILEAAREYWKAAKDYLHRKDPQLHLFTF
jgi:uncharacterized protein (UPF0332 family)